MSGAYIRNEIILYVVTNEFFVFMNQCEKIFTIATFFISVYIRNEMIPRKVIQRILLN